MGFLSCLNRNSLFFRHHLVLYCLFVVGSSTCWTQAIHVVSDVVEAELTDLQLIRVSKEGT